MHHFTSSMDQLHIFDNYTSPASVMLDKGNTIPITHHGLSSLIQDSQSLHLK